MKNKRHFTLIEIVVVITILAILLSIILIKVSDFKRKAIASSISSNISILQTATDSYYLKEDKYPILNQSNLSLSNPQLVNIDMLVKEGYLKKKLDTSKIKHQYYWIDVFGRVWGATDKNLDGVNLLKKKDGSKSFEFSINKKFTGFDIYEVIGYSTLADSQSANNLSADLTMKDKKSYKIIDSVTYNGSTTEIVNFDLPNQMATYLVSMTDEYGLNLPPTGPFNGSKSPMFRGDGVYTFEINGEEDMYWVDFLTLEEKKGNSTINYRFKVKDKSGEFLPWTDDFFSLPESKHIVVEIAIKSDSEGNTASIYDVQIIFKYKDEIVLKPTPKECKLDCYEDNLLCPEFPMKTAFNSYTSGLKVTPFYIKGRNSIENTYIQEPVFSNVYYKIKNTTYYIEVNGQYQVVTNLEQLFQNKCGAAVFDIEVLKQPVEKPVDFKICGSNSTENNLKGENKRLVYQYVLEDETKIKSIEMKSIQNLVNIYIEQSANGSPFEVIDSLADIKSPSCVNIVYEFEGDINNSNPPTVVGCQGNCPSINLCSENCISVGPVCIFDCEKLGGIGNQCVGPQCEKSEELCHDEFSECDTPPCKEKCLPVKQESEWITIETMRYFSNGPLNKSTRWLKAVTTEEVFDTENTRILYNYAKKNDSSRWSGLYEDFTKTGYANSVMAVAFIQVRKTAVDTVSPADYPFVKSISFETEGGKLPASMTNPSLVINPKKDNNEGRDVFSNESKIKWEADAADPRNLKITKIEWDGDVREQYPVGTYTIRAKATNERGYSSEWVSYRLVVVQEKPIALFVIGEDIKYMPIGEKIKFNTSSSVDPDGDDIVDYEWTNKKSVYEKEDLGKKTISLRIQDSEGYWSDWFSKEYVIYDPEDNLWFVDGEPAIPAGYYNMFDEDSGSFYQFRKKIVDVTWNGDLSGKTLNVRITGQVKFYDKNDNALLYLTESNNSYSEEGVVSRTTISTKLVIPEGAVKMRITGNLSSSQTFSVNLINLVSENSSLTALTDFKSTTEPYKADLSWKQNTAVKQVYVYDLDSKEIKLSTTTPAMTMKSLNPNSTYNYRIIAVNSDFIATKPFDVSITTGEPDVMFYGLDSAAFDTDLSTYTDYVGEANITWNKDISNETLRFSVSASIIRFYDKNNNLLNFLSSNSGQASSTSTSNDGNVRVIVPEGAVRMHLEAVRPTSKTNVASIYLINRGKKIANATDIQLTSKSYSITGSWKKTSAIYKVYMIIEEADQFFGHDTSLTGTIHSLYSDKNYKVKFIAVDKEFNSSEPIVLYQKTKPLEVNFTGLKLKSLDDYDASTEEYNANSVKVNWDKDISGRTLMVRGTSVVVTFYNSMNQVVNALNDTGKYEASNTGSTLINFIVPEGATSAIVKNGKGSSYNVSISVFRLVEPSSISKFEVISLTPYSDRIVVNYTKSSDVIRVFALIEDIQSVKSFTGNSITSNGLTPDTEYIIKYIAVDRYFNQTVITRTIRTLP